MSERKETIPLLDVEERPVNDKGKQIRVHILSILLTIRKDMTNL